MRQDSSLAELIDDQVETEAHQLVKEWGGFDDQGRDCWRSDKETVQAFAEWMLTRRPPAGNALRDLAARLTPNPALTVDGTLAIILDGLDKLDDERLARALAHASARQAGLDAGPVTDEQWKNGALETKLNLLRSARALKEALRIASTGQVTI